MPARRRAALDERPDREVFGKTKMCKFYLLGMCTRGSVCQFAHDREELTTPPDLSKTKLCKTLINTGRCEDRACPYAHNKEELRELPAPPRGRRNGALPMSARVAASPFSLGMALSQASSALQCGQAPPGQRPVPEVSVPMSVPAPQQRAVQPLVLMQLLQQQQAELGHLQQQQEQQQEHERQQRLQQLQQMQLQLQAHQAQIDAQAPFLPAAAYPSKQALDTRCQNTPMSQEERHEAALLLQGLLSPPTELPALNENIVEMSIKNTFVDIPVPKPAGMMRQVHTFAGALTCMADDSENEDGLSD